MIFDDNWRQCKTRFFTFHNSTDSDSSSADGNLISQLDFSPSHLNQSIYYDVNSLDIHERRLSSPREQTAAKFKFIKNFTRNHISKVISTSCVNQQTSQHKTSYFTIHLNSRVCTYDRIGLLTLDSLRDEKTSRFFFLWSVNKIIIISFEC